jgi:hypothetical protein
VRAITAARALQNKIRDTFTVKTRIGIAQGRMIYALTGSRNRYEQTLTGKKIFSQQIQNFPKKNFFSPPKIFPNLKIIFPC